jgi:hypothetical protein
MTTVCREGAFSRSTSEQVRGTLSLLRYYQRVLREMPEGQAAAVPGRENRGLTMDRTGARRRYDRLMTEAILSKTGSLAPINHRGQPYRKWSQDYQASLYRDCHAVRDHSRIRLRVYRLETAAARRRFAHILADRREDF